MLEIDSKSEYKKTEQKYEELHLLKLISLKDQLF